jgi:ubiquinone/menaquinone biosynthesis C-methylase UbiE
MLPIDLSNTQCPYCKSSSLLQIENNVNFDIIYENGIQCKNCSKLLPIIWGVPYLGIFRQEDVISLLEIAAHCDAFNISTKQAALDHVYWNNFLMEYCNSHNRKEILSKYNIKELPWWFNNRYNEHILFSILTQNISFPGKRVLDVGAGTGFDCLKCALAGAEVTAIEFNPILCGRGLYNFSSIRWIGGSAYNLPFQDESFDIVMANSALHHLIDIPTSIREMLRVLKPGGFVITMADSFRSNNSTEESEVAIFNDHEAVLGGINERVPKFQEFVETLRIYREYLNIRIFTSIIYDYVIYPREWTFDEFLENFSYKNGGISFIIKKLFPVRILPSDFDYTILMPSTYAKSLQNESSAVNQLVDLIPREYIDLPFLGNQYPKFRLLNGWKLYKTGDSKRTVYKRARLFFNISKAKYSNLNISLLVPYVGENEVPKIVFSLNGEIIYETVIIRGKWHDLTIPIKEKVKSKNAFALEIHIETKLTTHESKNFSIRNIEFTDAEYSGQQDDSSSAIEAFGIETLVQTGILKNKTCAIISSDFEHGLNMLNRLKNLGIFIDIIVTEGQEAFYSWLSGVKVTGTYSDEKMDSYNFQGIKLIIAPDKATTNKLFKMVDKNCSMEGIFIILFDGYADFIR